MSLNFGQLHKNLLENVVWLVFLKWRYITFCLCHSLTLLALMLVVMKKKVVGKWFITPNKRFILCCFKTSVKRYIAHEIWVIYTKVLKYSHVSFLALGTSKFISLVRMRWDFWSYSVLEKPSSATVGCKKKHITSPNCLSYMWNDMIDKRFKVHRLIRGCANNLHLKHKLL